MRRIFSLALVILAIASVPAIGADHSLGTWKLNLEKTKYTPAPIPVKGLTSVREAAPDGVKVTNTGERTDGSAINASYTAKYDGSSTPVSGEGAPYDTVSIKQIDANTFEWNAKKADGKYRSQGRIMVSPNGKTMTLRAKGTDPEGKPMTVTLVWDKQ